MLGAAFPNETKGIPMPRRPTRNKPQRQCAKCPWKVSTNPHDIPGGYDVEKHKHLANTIAEPGAFNFDKPLRLMACHETGVGYDRPCVGWLANQMGDGNNLALRYAVIKGRINGNVILDGEQHARLEDTLPGDE